MQFTIVFLLMGGLSIATAVDVKEIRKDLVGFLEHGNGIPIDLNAHHLELSNELAFTEDALVWKGRLDGHQEVAIKMFTNQSYFEKEIAGYRTANAMHDPNIESKGIPKIYDSGHIFGKYPVIVMSLFDETLLDRWFKQNKSFNAYSILEVFLQLTKTLAYLQIRGVMHNDIQPENIFLRGTKVFLADFSYATINGEQTEAGAATFASSGYFKYWTNTGELLRTYVDDLESLVYTIWVLERIHYNEPSGLTIAKKRDNKRFVMEKCKHFKNFPKSFEALKFICFDEMLSIKPYLDYKSIVKHLTAAIAEVTHITGQTRFEWLDAASSSSPSSYSFGYPGEERPDGKMNPDWFKNKRT